MKRLVCSVLMIALVVCMLPVYANAAECETIYLDDGSYIIVETITGGARASWSVSGGKQYTHYDSGGSSNWKVVLNGTFTYTGSSSTCTASSVDVTIYDSSWYVVSKSASKSGNTATGSVVMGEKAGGVTVTRVPVSLTLKCDANGNLS